MADIVARYLVEFYKREMSIKNDAYRAAVKA